jgi:hypothetical protein
MSCRAKNGYGFRLNGGSAVLAMRHTLRFQRDSVSEITWEGRPEMQVRSLRISVLAIGLALILTSCASSTRIVNQWVNPEYRAPNFKRILVMGVSKQPSLRRTFEDEFVARLKLEGVDAVPSYRYLPEDGEVAQERLQEAVTQANADAALITRLVKVENKTEVVPGFYHPAPALTFGFYPGYTAYWLGYYDPPRVYHYDVYISETSLYDLRRNQLVWSGLVQTTDPRDINKEIKRYVDHVIDALKSKNLLPARLRD